MKKLFIWYFRFFVHCVNVCDNTSERIMPNSTNAFRTYLRRVICYYSRGDLVIIGHGMETIFVRIHKIEIRCHFADIEIGCEVIICASAILGIAWTHLTLRRRKCERNMVVDLTRKCMFGRLLMLSCTLGQYRALANVQRNPLTRLPEQNFDIENLSNNYCFNWGTELLELVSYLYSNITAVVSINHGLMQAKMGMFIWEGRHRY